MERVTKFKTLDGVLHDSSKDAARHLDRMYGDLISQLSHGVIKAEKYVDIQEYIDSHLDNFLALAKIKDDMKLSEFEED